MGGLAITLPLWGLAVVMGLYIADKCKSVEDKEE